MGAAALDSGGESGAHAPPQMSSLILWERGGAPCLHRRVENCLVVAVRKQRVVDQQRHRPTGSGKLRGQLGVAHVCGEQYIQLPPWMYSTLGPSRRGHQGVISLGAHRTAKVRTSAS